ncbi:MAG: MMPL family transporter, partial [Planctomycetota bacterium]
MAGHHSGTDRSHRGGQPVLGEALRSVTRTVVAAPKITLLLALLVTGSCVAVTACYMRFKTERADLISPAADFHERWIEFTRSFGDADDLVLVVSADEPRVVKRTLQQIGDRLRREPELFADVLYKIEPRALRRKGLQYLTPTQLQRTLRRLEELRPLRQGRPDVAGIGQTTYRVAGELNRATRYAAAGETSPVTPSAQIRQAEALTDSLSRFMSDAGDFRSPWPELLDVDDRLVEDAARVHYFTNDRGTTGFIRVRPATDVTTGGFDGHAAAIDRLREIAGETSDPALGVSVGVTGIPVLESDEMRRSQTDMLRAGLYSFAGVGVLLLLGFKGLKHPVLALVMLAIALAWSFGFTTFSVGHLNILSVSFAVILIGLGIDFAIHYTSRYLEYRKEGYDLEEALGEASAGVGTGIVTAAVTTALAFFCATFTQFLGVAELGIIAGGGILLCALATFVILPPLIAIADANTDPEKLPGPGGLSWFNVGAQRFPTVMAALSLGVVLGLGYQAVDWRDELPVSAIGYDYNLLNLQAEGVESVELQKRIAEDGGSLLFAVSVADTPSEARALKRRFEALPTVGRVEELASRLPSHPPQQTRNLVDAIKAEVGRMPRDTPRTGAPNPRVVGKQLETLLTSLRYQRSPDAAAVAEKLDGLLDRFGRLPLPTQARFLSEWQRRSNAALVTQFAALGTATDP